MVSSSDDREPGAIRATPKMMSVMSEIGERAEYCTAALTDLPMAVQTKVMLQALEESNPREQRREMMAHLLEEVAVMAGLELIDDEGDPAMADQMVRIRDDCKTRSTSLKDTLGMRPRTDDVCATELEAVSNSTFHRRL